MKDTEMKGKGNNLSREREKIKNRLKIKAINRMPAKEMDKLW